jgi:NAD(P)-dependent dehydrogenase (short-subunit alcohol dehydrogenase family)
MFNTSLDALFYDVPALLKALREDVFVSAIADDFAEHGAKVIAQGRRGEPVAYLKIIGSLVPREMVHAQEGDPAVGLENLTLSELIELVEQAERRSANRRALLAAEQRYRHRPGHAADAIHYY